MLNEIRELELLCLCLEAVTEPDNAVALVAVLRSELFGLSDDLLYAFRRTGGRFAFHAAIPDTVSGEVRDAGRRVFHACSDTSHGSAVCHPWRPSSGLRPTWDCSRTATYSGGNVLAGSMARAFELIGPFKQRCFP